MSRTTRDPRATLPKWLASALLLCMPACAGATRPPPTPQAEDAHPAAESRIPTDPAGRALLEAGADPAVIHEHLMERLDSGLVAGARTTQWGQQFSTADPHMRVELAAAVQQDVERALRSAAQQLASAATPAARQARLARVLEAIDTFGFALGQRCDVMGGRHFPNSGMQRRFGVSEGDYRSVRRALCPIDPFC